MSNNNELIPLKENEMSGTRMIAPGMNGPGMNGPGMMAPGMMAPGMMAPGMMAPEMNPDMMGPESRQRPLNYDAPAPAPVEEFGNLNMNKFPVDLVLKSIFFGAIFYLLSLPEVYKMTKKCCKSVDGVLLHSIVFAILYFILVQFIN